MDIIYIIRDPENGVLFATSDANTAIAHSQERAADQHEHTLQAWHGSQFLGTISLQLVKGWGATK